MKTLLMMGAVLVLSACIGGIPYQDDCDAFTTLNPELLHSNICEGRDDGGYSEPASEPQSEVSPPDDDEDDDDDEEEREQFSSNGNNGIGNGADDGTNPGTANANTSDNT